MQVVKSYYLPSGRAFVVKTDQGYEVECTEMRDVKIASKANEEVRNTFDPRIVWKHLADPSEKWLCTVSTQMGCVHNCQFCDVARLPFKGNLTEDEILWQIELLIEATPEIKEYGTKKAKIGFARMGEPAHNYQNVETAIKNIMDSRECKEMNIHWLPCFNSIFPRKTIQDKNGADILEQVLDLKERCGGYLHLQVSCNSTDEGKRMELFGGANVLTLEEIINAVNKRDISNRTVTLNFIVMKGVPIDVEYLSKLGLNPNKFAVKLIPLNKTFAADENNLETLYNYDTYEQLMQYKAKFEAMGIPVVADAIAKCEEAGLCCGQLVQRINSNNIINIISDLQIKHNQACSDMKKRFEEEKRQLVGIEARRNRNR